MANANCGMKYKDNGHMRNVDCGMRNERQSEGKTQCQFVPDKATFSQIISNTSNADIFVQAPGLLISVFFI
jgi:hypothetical protein